MRRAAVVPVDRFGRVSAASESTPRRSPLFRAVVAAVAVTAAVVLVVGTALSGVVFVQSSASTPPRTNQINPDGRPLQPVPDVTPPGMVPRPQELAGGAWQTQRPAWQTCEGGQCATVLAPLDWGSPDGPTAITLSLLKVPASQSPRLGTIFVNPGGPGGDGTDYATSFSREGLEQYDIVGWDPRGVGDSTPVRCDDAALQMLINQDASPDDQGERTDLMQAEVNLGASCLAQSGALLQHISTEDTVRDLDMLRGIVGDQRLNYFGASYGTQVGARYAELFPERSGRLVLDGAVDVTGEEEVSQAQGFERALGNFVDWCVGQQQLCQLGANPDQVRATITELTEQADARPIRAGSRELTQTGLVTGISAVLYADETAFPYLAQGIADARSGNGELMLAFADGYYQREEDGSFGSLMKAFPAIRCLDEADEGYAGADAKAAEAAAAAPWAGRFMGPDYACPSWPVPAVPAPGPLEPATGARPILVVGTTGDPATPYENAVTMAKQLGVGRLVTFEGAGHVAYGRSSCVGRTVVNYFRDRIPEGETVCKE